MIKRYVMLAVVTMIVVIAAFTSQAAVAKQTSLDSRIFEAFKKIDGRTSAHEQDSNVIRKRLGNVSKQIELLNEKLAEVDDSDETIAAKKRRDIRGQLIELSAEYLNQAFKLVDAAAQVVSANLSDLASLADEVRKSGDPRGSVERLKVRIEKNVTAGKSMRLALVELRNWSHQDPNIAGRFQSLKRITMALDGRISVDKARLNGRSKSSPIRAQRDRLAALDRTVDRLGDMYAEVMSERESLIDLRNEVAMSIQLGRLEMTREVAERAIPSLIRPRDPSLGIKSLKNVATGIAKLNDSLIEDASGPYVTATKTRPSNPANLSIEGFKNF
jgi:hypothetical protein